MSRTDERGMILLNVLVIVAIASAVVVVMLASQDTSVDRSQRFREASQAGSIARGGELSAITALRRDALAGAASDNLREPWASVDQADTAIDGGRFRLSIRDAQAGFNLNAILLGGASAVGTFRDICAVRQVEASDCERLIFYIQATGPLMDAADLTASGVDEAALGRLLPVITALPQNTSVNFNTADESVLAALLRNSVGARLLVARRNGRGLLTPEDLNAAGIVPPAGVGFTSDNFWVETVVTVGDTPQRYQTLLQRRREGGRVLVAAVQRRRLPAPKAAAS